MSFLTEEPGSFLHFLSLVKSLNGQKYTTLSTTRTKMGHTLSKIKSKKKKEDKLEAEDYFIRNGSILLEKQIALSQGQDKGAMQLKILSMKDILKVTNSYAPDLVLAQTRRTIFSGTLDGQFVAVKVLRGVIANLSWVDLFLTEAAVGMVMNHVNITKLYGCCLETDIPIPVYEFMPNGGLYDHLHGATASRMALRWCHRLRIATDTAYALSYMHNAFTKPVVHRDVKSRSILLDSTFHAKLSNLGNAMCITPGDTSQKGPIRGTFGHIDPEYIETQQVTEKCDVYSFGVLMLELLSGRVPKTMAKSGTFLVDEFVSAAERDRLVEMIDGIVLDQASMAEIQQTARLALTCVARKGAERPTMIEVVQELWLIQGRGK